MKVSIIILNHDGLSYLKTCIPSVIQAKNNYNIESEIIVVDNASSDQSVNYLEQFSLNLRVLSLKNKVFFTKALNAGIRVALFPVVICLNNDLTVDKDFIQPLVGHFLEGKDIFAVGAKMLFQDTLRLNFGRTAGDFKYGFFIRKISDAASSVNTLYASAGGFAVDRDKFFKIGGFDENIDVYWEDLDLCYRAWKRGFRVIYEPTSVIYHKFHGTNLNKIGKKGIDLLSGQNYLLFIVKNIHNRVYFYRHLLFIPLLMILSFLIGKPYFALGTLRAIKYLKVFLDKRLEERNKSIVSDSQVLILSRK